MCQGLVGTQGIPHQYKCGILQLSYLSNFYVDVITLVVMYFVDMCTLITFGLFFYLMSTKVNTQFYNKIETNRRKKNVEIKNRKRKKKPTIFNYFIAKLTEINIINTYF